VQTHRYSIRVPACRAIGGGVSTVKWRNGGVSCSRLNASAKNGKIRARAWGSHSSLWEDSHEFPDGMRSCTPVDSEPRLDATGPHGAQPRPASNNTKPLEAIKSRPAARCRVVTTISGEQQQQPHHAPDNPAEAIQIRLAAFHRQHQ